MTSEADGWILNEEKKGTEIHLINIRDNGTYIRPRTMQHVGQVLKHDLGFDQFDFHSLRHTHCTDLLNAGVPPKDVQERLGHKHVETSLQTYTHVTDETKKKSREALNKLY
jgi:integrase